MLKKILLGGGVLSLLATFVFGRDALSYVWTGAMNVRQTVRAQVPVEFEIQRAHQLLTNLEPEIKQNLYLVAREEVELERLNDQVNGLQDKLARNEGELKTLQTELKSGRDNYTVNGQIRTAGFVKGVLKERFASFKTGEATLKHLQQMRDLREQKLQASRAKLEEMNAARKSLKEELARIEAQAKMVEVAKAASKFRLDDSQLGRVKELVNELSVRLESDEKYLAATESISQEEKLVIGDTAVTVAPADADSAILDEVASYFAERDQVSDVATK